MHSLTFRVPALNERSAAAFEAALGGVAGVLRVDTWPGRAELRVRSKAAEAAALDALRSHGFEVAAVKSSRPGGAMRVAIGGMTCRSCELTVEKHFKNVPGVTAVTADSAAGTARVTYEGERPDLAALHAAIEEDGYRVTAARDADRAERPSLARLAALFAAVLLMGAAFSRLGFFDRGYELGGGSSFSSALLIGLLAGSSSCVAVAGGLLLSSAKRFRERYGGGTAVARMRPVLMFVGGRVLGYAALGGAIGAVGSAIDPSPAVTGGLIIAAAAYMVCMGLDMLELMPPSLKRIMPRMPKALGRKVLDAEGKEHPIMPAALGAATFFLPCGFTQALQLYALSTGSFMAGAAVLGGFALGTAPVLMGLGWASTSLKGKTGRLFFQFSGALVIVLGLWNVQNGFTVAGHPLRLPELPSLPNSALGAASASGDLNDPNVVLDGGTQVIAMKLTGQAPFYAPSDRYTVRAGVPVRMVIDGVGTGCRSHFVIPKLGIKTPLGNSRNVVEFTPQKAGVYSFSCTMGMFPGTLHVIGG